MRCGAGRPPRNARRRAVSGDSVVPICPGVGRGFKSRRAPGSLLSANWTARRHRRSAPGRGCSDPWPDCRVSSNRLHVGDRDSDAPAISLTRLGSGSDRRRGPTSPGGPSRDFVVAPTLSISPKAHRSPGARAAKHGNAGIGSTEVAAVAMGREESARTRAAGSAPAWRGRGGTRTVGISVGRARESNIDAGATHLERWAASAEREERGWHGSRHRSRSRRRCRPCGITWPTHGPTPNSAPSSTGWGPRRRTSCRGNGVPGTERARLPEVRERVDDHDLRRASNVGAYERRSINASHRRDR